MAMTRRLPDLTDPEVLRDDWTDHPDLSPEEWTALGQLPDDVLVDALADAVDMDEYLSLLDRTRETATRALLRRLQVSGEDR
jgi:hypothetical protein